MNDNELVDLLRAACTLCGKRNGLRMIELDVGDRPLAPLLNYAVTDTRSELISVKNDGPRHKLAYFNEQWKGFSDDLGGLDAALAAKRAYGAGLQRAIAGASAAGGPDVRIFTQDPVFLEGLDANWRHAFRLIASERKKLSRLIEPADDEIIRVTFVMDLDKKERARACYLGFPSDHVEIQPDIDLLPGGIFLARREEASRSAYWHARESGETVAGEPRISIEAHALEAELRHHVHHVMLQGERSLEIENAGDGLGAVVSEFFDDLQYIRERPTHGVEVRPNPAAILEWRNPFKSGHAIAKGAVEMVRSMLLSRGVYSSPNEEKIMMAVEEALVRFVTGVKLRPDNILMDAAFNLPDEDFEDEDSYASSLAGETFDESSVFARVMRGIEKNFPEPVMTLFMGHLMEKVGVPAKERGRYLKIMSAEGPLKSIDAILKDSFGVSRGYLFSIGCMYSQLMTNCSAPKARSGDRLSALIFGNEASGDELYQDLRRLLLDSPFAYTSPEGKRYATQLEYLMDPEVHASIIDGVLAEFGIVGELG